MKTLHEQLSRRRAENLYRERLVLDSPPGAEMVVDGRRLLAFCSNDYLGLASDPRVVTALAEGARRWGAGAGASHLVSGHLRPHHALEDELAAFLGSERALLFSTGYMANLGVAAALTDRHGVLYEDRLNHASLIDAARLTRARVARYPHVGAARLEAMLTTEPRPAQLILTDAVFSMDGDLAPLDSLAKLAARHGARLLADDAHGLGVLGANGRGSFEQLGVPLAPPAILMGTLGKAFGTFGAFVAGEAGLIETLIQRARTYIYTTALPPAVAEATRASLKIVQQEPWRRTHLHALVARFRRGAQALGFASPGTATATSLSRGFTLTASATPIQPLILGSAAAAIEASSKLRAAGILVPAIRPPTVPEGSARLRIAFSAAHTEAQVDRLLEALAALKPSP
jgi:8-amino-7-oxononanoate synthase